MRTLPSFDELTSDWDVAPKRMIEFATIVSLVLVSAVFLYETVGLETEETVIPRALIVSALALFAVALIIVTFPDKYERFRKKFEIESDSDDGFDVEEELEELDAIEMMPWRIGVITTWLILYLLSLYYVGFFTTNFLFMFFYVYIHEPIQGRYRKVLIPLACAVLTVVVLYFLFAEMMRVASIWRLGMFA